MVKLVEKIKAEGKFLSEGIIDVESFISQQVDIELIDEAAKEIADHFANQGITKVFTIESSGITPAAFTARYMGLPLVILKKKTSKTQRKDVIQTEVNALAKEHYYELTLAKEFISADDHILLVDDFLSDGEAATGVIRLARREHATVAGVAVLIEKTFSPGAAKLRGQGIPLYSLAKVHAVSEDAIEVE